MRTLEHRVRQSGCICVEGPYWDATHSKIGGYENEILLVLYLPERVD